MDLQLHASVINVLQGRSPLHYAVASGFGIDLLLSHGAHINAVDFNVRHSRTGICAQYVKYEHTILLWSSIGCQGPHIRYA